MPSSRPERIEKARTLLQPAIPGPGGVWADLGCGDGIFTIALYALVRPGGEVYAVDKSQRALQALQREFTARYPDALVHPLPADFTRSLALPPLDGLVMANSLHFVRKKQSLLVRLAELLKPGGRVIVVEYNTSRGNPAVPYPLDANGFLKLGARAGLRQAQVVTRIPSTFLGEMYAGVAFAGPDAA
jgi:ubiquinone/menaquinone biosynthesis C-methylase UbiE